MSFCGLAKGISPKMCILCVRIKINKRSFEIFCVWILMLTVVLSELFAGDVVTLIVLGTDVEAV